MVRLLCVALVLALLLGGCWDYRDLETRSFILGLGVDPSGEPDGGYLVTVEVAHPQDGPPAGGGEGGGSGGSAGKVVVAVRGQTLADAILNLNSTLERFPHWRQLVAIVVSEDVARDNLHGLFDLFLRDAERNSLARLFITGGSAGDIIRFQPGLQPLTARVLRDLEGQRSNTARFAKPRYIRDVEQRLDDGVVLVPRIELVGGRLRAEGAAILFHHRLVGWLNGEETEGANWLLGDVRRLGLRVPCPAANSGHLVLGLYSRGRRLAIYEEGGLPGFHYVLSLNPANAEDRRRIEDAAGRALEQRVRRAIRRAQEELRVDVFRTGVQLRRNRPSLWRQIGDWDEVFPSITITVAANIEVRTTGGIDVLREGNQSIAAPRGIPR